LKKKGEMFDRIWEEGPSEKKKENKHTPMWRGRGNEQGKKGKCYDQIRKGTQFKVEKPGGEDLKKKKACYGQMKKRGDSGGMGKKKTRNPKT